ncbi:MAG: flavin reductase family protein, partial [Steroidobacteraceae bacterium]
PYVQHLLAFPDVANIPDEGLGPDVPREIVFGFNELSSPAGALARIACRVSQRYAGGDHTIIVGAIEACSARDAAPLAFHASRFGRFVQAPASAKVEVWPDPRDVWM